MDQDYAPGESRPDAKVRGVSAGQGPPGLRRRLGAAAIDGLAAILLLSLLTHALSAPPLPDTTLILLWAGTVFLLWGVLLAALGGTPGQRTLSIRLVDRAGRPVRVPLAFVHYLRGRLHLARFLDSPTHSPSAGAVLAGALIVATAVSVRGHLRHPVFLTAEPRQIPVFAPPDADGRAWHVLPFFYFMGAWPAEFRGSPVLYTLPYEKGPPERFVGRVVARLHMPDTRMIIEGPKTPEIRASLDELRRCFLPRDENSYDCAELRRRTLERHIDEMRAVAPEHWEVRWFEVANPAVAPEESPRGVFISARGGHRAQDRFILINAEGTHQALILSRPLNSHGDEARRRAIRTVGSLRLTSRLSPGRTLVNSRLAGTRITGIREAEDSEEFIRRLAQVQAALIAKITVDPKEIQTYYHMGGTALMMIQHAKDVRTRHHQVLDSRLTLLLDEWTAAAKPLVRTAKEYAHDVAPEHPHTRRLDNLWIEASKY